MRKSTTGFTIVELLIVIIVIAILATITIVAYNGMQDRAKMVKLKADYKKIETALELHRADKGVYPQCPIANPGNGCSFSLVTPMLETQGLPTTTLQDNNILYVGAGTATLNRWAVRLQLPDASYCKLGTDNLMPGWWGGVPLCW